MLSQSMQRWFANEHEAGYIGTTLQQLMDGTAGTPDAEIAEAFGADSYQTLYIEWCELAKKYGKDATIERVQFGEGPLLHSTISGWTRIRGIMLEEIQKHPIVVKASAIGDNVIRVNDVYGEVYDVTVMRV